MGLGLALGAASLVTTAVGTGLSVYAQTQQAGGARAAAGQNAQIDVWNAAIQRQNAQIQATSERRAAELAMQSADLSILQTKLDTANARWQDLFQQTQLVFSANQADQNAIILEARAQVQENNSITLFRYGRLRESQGREQARRIRDQGDRVLGMTKGRIAKSGVQFSGSPLDVLADTAAIIELGAQDAVYEAELAARELYQRSENELFESKVTIMGATQQRQSAENYRKSRKFVRAGTDLTIAGNKIAEQAAGLAKQAAGYRIETADYAYRAADAGFAIDLSESRLNQFAAESKARSLELASWGTLINGASSMLNQGGTMVDSFGGGRNLIGEAQYYTGTVPKARAA